MTRAEIDRLLALYSSGAISAAERDALYRAALEDPALFEELFDEDTLREALHDPDVRAAALAAPAPSARSAPKSRWTWWRWPALAAVAATAVLMIVVVRRPASVPPPPVELPQNRTPAPAPPSVADSMPVPRDMATPASAPSAPVRKAQSVAQARGKSTETAIADAAPAQAPDAATLMAESKPRGGALGPGEGGGVGRVSSAPPAPAAVASEPSAESAAQPVRSEALQVSAFRTDERLSAGAESRARRDSNATAAGKAESAPVPAASTFAAQRAGSLLTATLSARGDDGQWHEVAINGAVSQDTPLRLTIAAKAAGVVSFAPAFTPPVALRTGESRVFDLPRQDFGAHTLRVSLRRSSPPRKSAARDTFSAAPGVLPPAPPAPAGETSAVEIRFQVR